MNAVNVCSARAYSEEIPLAPSAMNTFQFVFHLINIQLMTFPFRIERFVYWFSCGDGAFMRLNRSTDFVRSSVGFSKGERCAVVNGGCDVCDSVNILCENY